MFLVPCFRPFSASRLVLENKGCNTKSPSQPLELYSVGTWSFHRRLTRHYLSSDVEMGTRMDLSWKGQARRWRESFVRGRGEDCVQIDGQRYCKGARRTGQLALIAQVPAICMIENALESVSDRANGGLFKVPYSTVVHFVNFCAAFHKGIAVLEYDLWIFYSTLGRASLL